MEKEDKKAKEVKEVKEAKEAKEVKEVKPSLNLLQKILELQKALSLVLLDVKGEGFMYASGEQVLRIARPKMDELGLLLLQEMVDVKIEHVLWKLRNGEKQQTFAQCQFKFTWIDVDSGDKLEQRLDASGFNSWDKAIGSAMTYAERYFFMKTFHIPTDDLEPNQRKEKYVDDDGFFDTGSGFEKKEVKLMTDTQKTRLTSIVTERGISPDEIKLIIRNKYGVGLSKELTTVQAEELMSFLKNNGGVEQKVKEAFGDSAKEVKNGIN